jgi:hypothetical protein
MYVKVPETVSHAQRTLITLIENRKFTYEVINTFKLAKTDIGPLYRIAVNKIRPYYSMIFNMRVFIPPAAWYFKENEQMPVRIPITPLYGGYTVIMRDKIKKDMTTGLQHLEALRRERKLTEFCIVHELKYSAIADCIIPRRGGGGTTAYHRRPGFAVIEKLKRIIHPDYWYIFPEELIKTAVIKTTALLERAPDNTAAG